jgi:hypothetical protein
MYMELDLVFKLSTKVLEYENMCHKHKLQGKILITNLKFRFKNLPKIFLMSKLDFFFEKKNGQLTYLLLGYII